MFRLLFVLLLTLSAQAFAARNIVLVPGFFSSAIPAPSAGGDPWKQPYFSQDIVKYLARSGDRLWVVDNLNPLGGVAENGQNLISFLQAHKARMQEPILLIAHSAGGLYSLYAAAKSDFPIHHIITVSTPFAGLKLLENLEHLQVPVDQLAPPFCLENLLGLKEEAVVGYLKDLTFRRPLRIDVFAGYQKPSLATWDWRNLSSPLLPFQALILEKSDGIVSVQSSLAATPLLGRKANLNLQIHQEPIGLEHWEFNLDADFSVAFGVLNLSGLRNAQEWAYYKMLKKAGAIK